MGPATARGIPAVYLDGGFDDFFRLEALNQVRRATLLLGSVDDANDVVQEALLVIYRRWNELDHPGSYLNRTVLNLCRDRFRRQSTLRRLLPTLAAETVSSASNEVLDDILLDLPFNQRAAIVLRYWGGLTTQEIADQLGCPTGSVGPWIDRGLSKMRKVLT